jgi:hypothetical protein
MQEYLYKNRRNDYYKSDKKSIFNSQANNTAKSEVKLENKTF